MLHRLRPAHLLLLPWLLPLAAAALCTSDGVAPPTALLERFTSADCAACWSDAATPAPAAGTLAIDWIVPGRAGQDAPLSAVASEAALERLQLLRRVPPATTDAVSGRRSGPAAGLRLAQGEPFNDYLGTSIELAQPGRAPWQAWLLLVESLPAGTEGSPVARNLVRNVFRPDWQQPARRPTGALAEQRAMQIHAGAGAERLRLVAVLHDGQGKIRAISHTQCEADLRR